MDQYDKFLSYENFELAYQRLKTAPRNLYKIICYEDLKNFSLFKDDYIENIIKNIKDEIYSPDKCYKIFIPKKGMITSTAQAETIVDLHEVNAEMVTLKDKILAAVKTHNKYLKELGLPELP